MRIKDLTGQKFGNVSVLGFHSLDRKHWAVWLCRCVCGNECLVSSHDIKRKKHISCGCVDGKRERRKPLSNQSAFCNAYYGIKRGALSRNYVFQITKEQFKELSQQDCFYCGEHPNNVNRTDGQTFVYSGLDRVDNARGYLIDNVVPCCKFCNRAKDVRTKVDFLSWIRRVYERQY